MRVKLHLALGTLLTLLSFSCLAYVPFNSNTLPSLQNNNASIEELKRKGLINNIGAHGKIQNTGVASTDPQDADKQKKIEEALKNKPSWVKDEWIQKYGLPKDLADDPGGNPWYGYESEQRASLRRFISANGMRAKDAETNMIREGTYQNNAINVGVVCGDQAAMITPYLLMGIDPTLFKGGQVQPGQFSNWSASDALLNMGYQWLPPGTPFQAGDIIAGTGHAFDWWQTADDALGKTSTPNGAGVSHWPDGYGGVTNLALAHNGNEGVYRLTRSPYIEDVSNADGSKGVVNQVSMQSSALTKYWMDIKAKYFSEPKSYLDMRTRNYVRQN